MDTFERAFSDTEQAAAATLAAAAALVRQAKALQKAAREGNIAAIKGQQSSLESALSNLGQTVKNSVQIWPFQEEQEEQYLREDYAAELIQVAAAQGLQIHERDGILFSSPSFVRILPGNKAVRIGKKQTSTIRPSHLVGLLQANQKRASGHRPEQFLESLYRVYVDISREDGAERLMAGRQGRVIPLARIYRLITARPGDRREYNETDFARDLYQLDSSGIKTTRSGATVSFPASTGARSSRGVFTFVGPDGSNVSYYGIRFTAAE